MAGNTIGHVFRLTTFGESHGVAIGGIIDGCPAGLLIDNEFIQQELDRRKPGITEGSTERNEDDHVEFLSGIFKGKSTGAPIAFLIKNQDSKPEDYNHLKDIFRPSHADYTWHQKYGFRDYRGGGRSSARETAARVVGGAIAKLFLKQSGISVQGYVSQIGHLLVTTFYQDLNLDLTYKSEVRCPEKVLAPKMIEYLEMLKNEGDTAGGMVTCIIQGVPVGLGEPVFDKLNADLAKAMMSINAAKGFEIGTGFAACLMRGSENNDAFENIDGKITTKTNFSGGIQGGISNGEDIYFNVAFKPVSTIKKTQQTVDIEGNNIELKAVGRHDVCVVPRAVAIVEAMAAIIITDHLLRNRATKI